MTIKNEKLEINFLKGIIIDKFSMTIHALSNLSFEVSAIKKNLMILDAKISSLEMNLLKKDEKI